MILAIYILQTILGTIYWFKTMKYMFDEDPKYNPLILIGSFIASSLVIPNIFLILMKKFNGF